MRKSHLVGGANSAGQAAMHFSRWRCQGPRYWWADSLTRTAMSEYLIDQIEATPNIASRRTVPRSGPCPVTGRLECSTLKTPRGQETRAANSIIISHRQRHLQDGLAPAEIALDDKGFILAGPDLKTRSACRVEAGTRALPGWKAVSRVSRAGDVRFNSGRRCASAVGEGSIAVQFMHQ